MFTLTGRLEGVVREEFIRKNGMPGSKVVASVVASRGGNVSVIRVDLMDGLTPDALQPMLGKQVTFEVDVFARAVNAQRAVLAVYNGKPAMTPASKAAA